MSTMKKPLPSHNELSKAELDSEREQLLSLRRQPNVDKKLIAMALKSEAARMTIDEINEYLGRSRELKTIA